MNLSRAREVLYDSETVLRLVDHELDELRDLEPADAPGAFPDAFSDAFPDGHTDAATEPAPTLRTAGISPAPRGQAR